MVPNLTRIQLMIFQLYDDSEKICINRNATSNFEFWSFPILMMLKLHATKLSTSAEFMVNPIQNFTFFSFPKPNPLKIEEYQRKGEY